MGGEEARGPVWTGYERRDQREGASSRRTLASSSATAATCRQMAKYEGKITKPSWGQVGLGGSLASAARQQALVVASADSLAVSMV